MPGSVIEAHPLEPPARPELAQALAALQEAALELERRRQRARRVDGRIIGTGQADFTKTAAAYELQLAGKPFQLIDVPGIEGDEQRYGHLVEEAVAKAHLIFLVNGTNKKPEAATVQRIRRYLRRHTKVLPIVNVRGYADAYEFEEDRVGLAQHEEAAAALAQTRTALAHALGDGTVLPGLCVQGSLAFLALAIDGESGLTGIHPDREDLVRHQRSCLAAFGSPQAMLDFSEVGRLVEVLGARAGTLESDIVESNKAQVLALLGETLDALARLQALHGGFMASVAPHFAACLEALEQTRDGFLRDATAQRRHLWETFFIDLAEDSDRIVEAHFGDREAIEQALHQAVKARQDRLASDWARWLAAACKRMNEDLATGSRRLIEDVARLELRLTLDAGPAGDLRRLDAGRMEMDLTAKEWGGWLLGIGSYALSGSGIGSLFPGIGNLAGAIAGAVVGLLHAVASWFTGRAGRVRKAQKHMHAQIEDIRRQRIGELDAPDKALARQLRAELDQRVREPVLSLKAALDRPQAILEQQMAALAGIRKQIEEMSDGTVGAIRR